MLPCPKLLDLNVPPDVAVTLWSTESSFVHLIVWPTFAVIDLGLNWMFFIETATVAPPVDGLAAGVLLAGGAAAGALLALLFELELLLPPQPATSAAPSARQAATE